MSRNWYLLFAGVLLAFVVACGGMEPDTEPIETFPDAQEITGDESFVVDLLEGMSDEMVAGEDFEAVTEFYQLTDGATFEDAEAFYDEQLTPRDWTKQEDAPEIEGGGVAGWEHGRDQAFFIMVMPDELSGMTVMMTMAAQR